ncbi:MAG: tRNA (adenosine(37)-N6)-dimethylallyltransferase MiaA [Lachnospiraceae bacterium]|nr:tRNA (adenosine(37)-N6)-dimethylallyltransferase MiaA [Lachnospiraceae bacterium]
MKKLLILTGPTGVGKTSLSTELAKELSGEIKSADSVAVYKGMDIGSAKIKPEEMGGVPHHLIDVLDPNTPFTVYDFKNMAKAAMEGIYERNHLPIIVGGTGFYIQSVLYDIDFTEEETDLTLREELMKEAEEKGVDALYEELQRIDPEATEYIHKNNVKRVVRAIEYYRLNNEKISEHNKREREKKSPYDFKYFVLIKDREELYKDIEKRVDLMMEEGLVSEVERLLNEGVKRESTSMQSLGYKQIAMYLSGEISLDRAIYLIKRDTRHFAKRQLTWFRREKDAILIRKEDVINDRSIITKAI